MSQGHRIRPKIVASTATVRRANTQIRALFDRAETQVFPPPGVDRRDSWFAHTLPPSESPARLYLGLAAQGRGPKVVFLRGLTTLMAAAAALYERLGDEPAPNAADAYMSAVCYFNALRELGGARRIVEDEVEDRVARYGRDRQRLDPPEQVFVDRAIGEPMELTSRVSTDDVAKAKARLERLFESNDEKVDVALATNMISVGLDISRLGLMLVQGQPKTAAEYIQATSRVGRDSARPGLVVTVLNLHKPRDRAHYESFRLFHETFYRAVEATSVTPWAARALDRSLAAIVVAIARHLRPELTPETAVGALAEQPGYIDEVVEAIVTRAPEEEVVGGRAALEAAVRSLLRDWQEVVAVLAPRASYAERGGRKPLLHLPLDPDLINLDPVEHRRFVAARSMRDVEANVALRLRDPNGRRLRADDAV
ncbi:MAG: helicase-related protein [Pseudomonadota bacterium]